MLAPNATASALLCLGEVGTAHVWFTSEGNPRGADITADVGDFLCLPGDSCGCHGSSWWDLLGSIDSGQWVWNGEGEPVDCDGKRVTRIVAQI